LKIFEFSSIFSVPPPSKREALGAIFLTSLREGGATKFAVGEFMATGGGSFLII